jgi:RNA polymerase sigma factor (sigma-70 family)
MDEAPQTPRSSLARKPDVLESTLAILAKHPRDQMAWENLYRELWPWVMATMYRGLGAQRALAEEASQEVFMKLLRYARFDRQGHHAAQFRSFVKIVAAGILADYQRSLGREQKLAPRADPDSGPEPAESLADPRPSPEHDQVGRSVFDELMRQLNDRDRTVAELFLAHGSTPREIAATMARDVREIYESVARIKLKAKELLVTTAGRS